MLAEATLARTRGALVARRPKIGLSACFSHADTQRKLFIGKTLQYVEQTVAHWLMSSGALVAMVPSPSGGTAHGEVGFEHYADWLDGLVLHGGADVWPGSYGEDPLAECWIGDRIRDEYDLALVAAFVAAGKPVFGICRGLQLLNVAFGGTLWQDLHTQLPNALVHRDAAIYDNHFHGIDIVPGTRLAALHPGVRQARVNSIHHQGIKQLSDEFVVEAVSSEDGVIEAIRRKDPSRSYIAAVQWHPEWHRVGEPGMLDGTALLDDFFGAVAAARVGSRG